MGRLTPTAPAIDADCVLAIHHTDYPTPPDVVESVRALRAHSRFAVLTLNASFGYPAALDRLRFRAILLHYTMFYSSFAPLGARYRAYVTASDAFKVALFQDEQANLPARVALTRALGLDLVYSCFDQADGERVYGGTGAGVVEYLPGYVSDRLRLQGDRLARPDPQRPIDIGYRGRKPPESWGGAAREKYEIAAGFKSRASGLGLRLDIETGEEERIYGDAWLEFVASCRAMLGTESGAAVADPAGGGEIPYRTISPRHFEAAAMRSCQILFEGRYSGAMDPMTHYIPLRKDFADFDLAIERFKDPALRARIAANAHRDLIASGRYGYRRWVEELDARFGAAGLEPPADREAASAAGASALYPPRWRRRARRVARGLRVGARIAVNRLRGRPASAALRSRQ